MTRCHAGAGHAEAFNRGTFGWLCGSCWAATLRVLRIDPTKNHDPGDEDRSES